MASDFMLDLRNVIGTTQASQAAEAAKEAKHSTNKKAGSDLEMEDFLKLMVAMFQNQSMDDTADTGEMMNQMVQMSVIQAVTNLSAQVSASTNVNYAASLVGKEVLIGERVGVNQINEISGVVTGTGMLDGEQVIFVGNNSYKLTDILAIGKLPEDRAKIDEDLMD